MSGVEPGSWGCCNILKLKVVLATFQCFDEAVARQNGMKEDQHVAAYALYEMGVMLSQNAEVSVYIYFIRN